MKAIPVLEMAYDEEGKKFHRWTIIYTYYAFSGDKKYKQVLARCDCGAIKRVLYKNLINGETQSCGCWNKEVLRHVDHGMTKTRTYRIWACMINRCTRSNHKKYMNYGGRGITICESWRKFKNFFADMGECPATYSIDRIDPNGNYEPRNCRWTDWKTQCRNKLNTVYVEYQGKTWTLPDLAEAYGFRNSKILYNRIFSRGWSIEDAVSIPTGTNYRNRRTLV